MMGDLRRPHLPEALAARYNVACALGTLVDSVDHLVHITPVALGAEGYHKALQHHVDQLKLYLSTARREAEDEPPTIGMPSIPPSWTACLDGHGSEWLRYRDGERAGDWFPGFALQVVRNSVRLECRDDELIYEYGPIRQSMDPRE